MHIVIAFEITDRQRRAMNADCEKRGLATREQVQAFALESVRLDLRSLVNDLRLHEGEDQCTASN